MSCTKGKYNNNAHAHIWCSNIQPQIKHQQVSLSKRNAMVDCGIWVKCVNLTGYIERAWTLASMWCKQTRKACDVCLSLCLCKHQSLLVGLRYWQVVRQYIGGLKKLAMYKALKSIDWVTRDNTISPHGWWRIDAPCLSIHNMNKLVECWQDWSWSFESKKK